MTIAFIAHKCVQEKKFIALCYMSKFVYEKPILEYKEQK